VTSVIHDDNARSNWIGTVLRFIGFVFVPSSIIIVLGGAIGHAPWLGVGIIIIIAGVIGFPASLDYFFGSTRNFSRILLAISLFPSLIFASALFISNEKIAPAGDQAPERKAVSEKTSNAPVPAVAAVAPAPKLPSHETQPAQNAKKETLSWASNFLKNETSRVVLELTAHCTAYFNNKKVATTTKSTLDFTDSAVGVPVLPAESRKYKPTFKFDGSRDDVNDSLTQCELKNIKYAEPDEDVPISISLSSKKSAYYGDHKAVATLVNQSTRKLSIKKLKMACVIRNDRALTDEEMLNAMKSGVYADDDMVHISSYYDNLIAKPLSSNGDTRVDIPVGSSEEVRLYKAGGMFSSDEELGIGTFTAYKCWVPD